MISVRQAVVIVEEAARVASHRARGLDSSNLLDFGTPGQNEAALFAVIQEVLHMNGFSPEEILHVGGHKFPDLLFPGCGVGVEVKGHEKGGRILGNSIMGSTLVADQLEEVLVLIWNKSTGVVVCRNYFECVVGAEVTHSPRFVLEIDPEPEKLLFGEGPNAIGSSKEICLGPSGFDSELILTRMRALALSKGEIPWWIHQKDDDGGDSMAAIPTLALERYTSLPESIRRNLLRTSLILFPEILSSAQQKYSRVISWAIATKSVLITRDAYSAEGVANFVYPAICDICTVPAGRVLANAVEWFRPGAEIDQASVASVLDGDVDLENLADRFRREILVQNLKGLYEITIGGLPRDCSCQSIGYSEFRERVADDLGGRIRSLSLA
jgi:hypothetical protein